MIKFSIMALSVALFTTSDAYADANGRGGKQYDLVDGTTFTHAGAMFQHLRDRGSSYASGDHKDSVEAYPEEFDDVCDLIHEKRVD